MYYDKLMQQLSKEVEDIRGSQSQLEEELLYTQKWLGQFIDNMDTVNKRLKEIESQKEKARLKPKAEKPYMSEEDFKALLEKLLQGSLDNLGDKISQKVLDKLKDLQGSTGLARETKIKELKQLADAELVDLSRLFIHGKVESNIEEIGVEEKESKGIDKSLEKLRKMKEDKSDQENKDNNQKVE